MDKKEKLLDDFLRKSIKNVRVEKTSADFTANIMSQIAVAKQSEVKRYKKLISRPVWAAIFIIVFGLFIYLNLDGYSDRVSLFSKINFNFIKESKLIKEISIFSINKIVSISIAVLAVMTMIQVPIYKNYFNKRLRM
tara:strand:+ start:4856 stop:5266 length:411 start_codon:yes stop_codon:yes gene_type:complete